MKNMQFGPYLWPNRQNSRVIKNRGHRFSTGSRNKAVLRMRNEKYAIWPIFITESPKYLHYIGNRGRRTRWWRQILTESRNKTVWRMLWRNEKYAIWRLVMAESPKLPHNSAMVLWTRLWSRYHVPQNVFLVVFISVSTCARSINMTENCKRFSGK